MKVIIITFFLTFCVSGAFTQYSKNTDIPKTSFPQNFIGNWKGTLLWYRPGTKEPKKITMQLRIQPSADSAGMYTWNLKYGDSAKDNRPYLLKPVDSTKGHWVVDEVNSIKLDGYWMGEKFCSVFTVDNVTIVNNCWLEDGNLVSEFFSYPSKPVAITGKGTEDAPFVNSFEIKTYQKAVLKKQ